MNCVNIKPCLSAYPAIAPSRSAAPATKPGFTACLRLNKSSSTFTVASLRKLSLKAAASTCRYKQSAPVCLFGGKQKSGNGNEATPREALEDFIGSLKKEESIEDVLRQQIKKQEFYDDGGSGRDGFGGGGGGGSDGSGGSEDESISGMLDELMQMVLATLGFIFLYIYILEGEDISRYTKDVIKYIFGGKKSLRLGRAMEKWRRYFKRLTEKKKVDPYWLERAILITPTWYDSPKKYRELYYDLVDDGSRKTRAKRDSQVYWGDEDEDEYYY